jgi:hypothetical protein
VICSAPVWAQTAPLPTSYEFVFRPNDQQGGDQFAPIAASTYVCNLPASATPPAGTKVYATWGDPEHASMVCRYYDQGSGVFTTRFNRRFGIGLGACITIEGALACTSAPTQVQNWIYRVLPNPPTGFSVPVPTQAVIGGSIGQISANWIFPTQPGWRLINFNGPFGQFQMMAGGENKPGQVNLPGFDVREGQLFEITIVQP